MSKTKQMTPFLQNNGVEELGLNSTKSFGMQDCIDTQFVHKQKERHKTIH